ncbi:MAG TPA: hypothetical protein VFX67_04755 [Burkholderiales bacterium]|nr:hypothetical protein [Burkholderiales bacterium]
MPARFVAKLIALFRQHVVLATVLVSILSAVLGAYCMYRFLAADLPALRAEYQKVAAEVYAVRSDLSAADLQQRSTLDAHMTQEKASRERMTNSLQALNANLIALGSKLEARSLKSHEARDLLASVREISLIEAASLDSIAVVGGVLPEEYAPLLAYARKEEELKEFAGFFSAATPSVQPAYLGKLLLTRQGSWHVLERQILFKWDGGSARLRAKNDLPQSELVRKVELFNSVSRAVSHAGAIAQPSHTAPTKASAKPIAVRTNAANVQRRSQPPRRVEVVKRPEPAPIRRPAGPASY